MPSYPVRRARDRLAAGFLLLLIGVGSLMLWIGIPAGALWALSKVTESSTRHFVLGLVAVPAAMLVFAPVLFWLNGLYLRVTGALQPEEDDEDRRWRLRGPLELFLYASPAIALVILFVWIFFLAVAPPYTVW
jgi:heme/copper-type cytochrome/quinol oxidase subunit 2